MRTRTKLLISAGAVAIAARWLSRRRCWRDFEGRVVLISGGSRGLGLALARQFAARGARLALCARDESALERVRRELEASGAEVLARGCDLRRAGQPEEFVREAERRFGRVDVVVHNAGIIQVGPLETMTFEDFDSAMATHFGGALRLILAALPGMRRRGDGRIVNIASIGGRVSVPHLLPYSASKFALVGLSEGLRAELAKDGIRVTTVCPGLMRTGSPPNALFKGRHRQEYAWFSVSDSLPLLSAGAERAARRIVEACRRGDADLTLTVPAMAATRLHGLFPGLTADVLGFANRWLPRSGGIGSESRRGRESESLATRALVTRLSRRAERRQNQI